jgi:hypothetical protein
MHIRHVVFALDMSDEDAIALKIAREGRADAQ